MGSHNFHTPITGTPDVQDAMNTALGELDTAIGGIGVINNAVIGHSVSDGTDGGSVSAVTWNVRTLAGLEVDADGIVAINSNQFTLSKGTYIVIASGSTFGTDEHRLQVYNATQTSVVYSAAGGFSNSSEMSLAHMMSVFTANGSDAFEIRHFTEDAVSTTGFGYDDSGGNGNEIYLQVLIVRIGL